MKKIFAMIITVCLLVCALGISVFAAEAPAPGVVLRVSALKDNDETETINDETETINDFTSFQDGWSSAIKLATNKDELKNNRYVRVIVDFYADWNANAEGEFGSGDGFSFSTLFIPDDVNITLNLNGHKIDRDLKEWEYDGEVMHINEGANVVINDGTVTGGWSCNGAGGIYVEEKGTLVLNNVHLVDNKVEDDDGTVIAAYDNSTIIMNGGSISNNRMYYSNPAYATHPYGTLHLSESKAFLTNVEIANNDSAGLQWAEGLLIYLDESEATLENCVIKNNGWIPDRTKDPAADKIGGSYAPNSLFYIGDSDSSLTVTGCKFENNGDEKQDLTGTEGRLYDIFDINDGKLVVTDSSFENNHLNHIISAFYGTFEVENCRFINNRARLFYCIVDSGHFTKCTFSGNNLKGENGVFLKYLKASEGIRFSDCEFIDNPLTDEKYAKSEILNNDTPNGAGSIFGEGSLTMIVALLALIASGVAIFLTVYYNKKKEVPAAANNATEIKDEE